MARISREKNHRGQPLFDLLLQIRETDCADPRDRVFASLAHVSEDVSPWITVDYSKSLAEVYIDVVRYAIHSDNIHALSFLGHVYTATPSATNDRYCVVCNSSILSWVPDWRQRIKTHGFSEPQDGLLVNMYNPCPDTTAEVTISLNNFEIRGFVFDSLDVLTSRWFSEYRRVTELKDWYPALTAAGASVEEDVVERSMVGDTRWHRYGGREVDKVNGQSRVLLRGGTIDWALINGDVSALDVETKIMREDMGSRMVTACHARRGGITRRSDMGIFPAASESGDLVAAFYGGHALYVVRPDVAAEGMYRFIGECYVDGMMDGTAMELASAQGITAGILTLV